MNGCALSKRSHIRCSERETVFFPFTSNTLDKSYPAYPDFEECPEYTDEGRPFATAEQESCPHCKPNVPENPTPGDCGGCGWFYREHTHYDPIGVCMCDALRSGNRTESEESK